MVNVITEYDNALFINDYRVPFVVKDSVAVDKKNRQVTLTIAASHYFRVREQIESEEIYKFSDERVTAEVVMNKEKIIAKNGNASIALDTDGKILIDAEKITTGSIDSRFLLNQDLLGCLYKGVEYLASNCIHSQIVITADGITLQDTKEFHPASETLLD